MYQCISIQKLRFRTSERPQSEWKVLHPTQFTCGIPLSRPQVYSSKNPTTTCGPSGQTNRALNRFLLQYRHRSWINVARRRQLSQKNHEKLLRPSKNPCFWTRRLTKRRVSPFATHWYSILHAHCDASTTYRKIAQNWDTLQNTTLQNDLKVCPLVRYLPVRIVYVWPLVCKVSNFLLQPLWNGPFWLIYSPISRVTSSQGLSSLFLIYPYSFSCLGGIIHCRRTFFKKTGFYRTGQEWLQLSNEASFSSTPPCDSATESRFATETLPYCL